MFLKRPFTVAAAAAATVLLHGCATAPIPEPTEYYKSIENKVAQGKALVVVSGCALRDEVGEDLFLMDAASKRAHQFATSTTAYLSRRAGTPVVGPVLLMCGGYKPDPMKPTLRFAKDSKAPVEDGALPHAFDDATFDAETVANLSKLFDEAYTMPNSVIAKAGDTPPVKSIDLLWPQLDQIAKATGADYVWLVSGDSMEVSMGKVVGSAVLTAVLTLGMVASAPTGGSSTMAALVDVKGKQIVWKKMIGTINGKMYAETQNYGSRHSHVQSSTTGTSASMAGDDPWAIDLFAPLLDKAAAPAGLNVAAESPAATADAPAPAGEAAEVAVPGTTAQPTAAPAPAIDAPADRQSTGS